MILVLVALSFVSIGSSPLQPRQSKLSPDLALVVEGNSAFAFDLLGRLKSGDGNLIFSPFSVSSTLALAYGGARGNTEMQMAQTLRFPTNQSGFHIGMAEILDSFRQLANEHVELTVRNSMWPQRDYHFLTAYLDLCRTNYRAYFEFMDFHSNAEPARRRINAWIERSTAGKINGLLAPGSVSTDTRLVLANATYFKGKWQNRFEKNKTISRPFWVTPNGPVQVPMMSQKATFLHLVDGDTQILELPYEGQAISMLLLLPKARDGLPALEARLSLKSLTNWIERLRPMDVDLLLPRFKIRSQLPLRPTLAAMGMSDAFSETRADFSGMTSQRPLFVSEVQHAALVEVDEEGTVAAAGTGVSFGCSQRLPPVLFAADHPFILLILHKPTRSLLFIGRLANPRASA